MKGDQYMGDQKTGPEPTAERWTFGGSRVGGKGQRVHEWIDEHGNAMHFKARGSYTVGNVYTASVVRSDADRVTLHGSPVFYGRSEDETLREQLSANHRASEMTLSLKARERKAKEDDPVEVAITRLAELAKHVPPSQRASFAAYVMNRVGQVW